MSQDRLSVIHAAGRVCQDKDAVRSETRSEGIAKEGYVNGLKRMCGQNETISIEIGRHHPSVLSPT